MSEAPSPLCCPSCRQALDVGPGTGASEILCPSCSARYPCLDGVIDFLPGQHEARTLAQRVMESRPIVRIYESRLWRRNPVVGAAFGISFERERELVLEAVGPVEQDCILDLACGPGIYSRPIARLLPRGQVIGLDLSLPMLRYASRRAREENLANVHLVRASALDLPLRDSSIDAVVCCGALHLFPDVPRVLSALDRALKPGGRVVLAVFRRGRGRWGRLRERSQRLYGVVPFDSMEMGGLLAMAGLGEFKVHHDKALWLVVSARKSAAGNMEIQIRRAGEADCAGVLDCIGSAFEEYRSFYTLQAFEHTVLTPGIYQDRLKTMTVYVAADENGKILGTISWGLGQGGDAHIRGLAVRPERQGEGIAGRLLTQVEGEMLSAGCRLATLDTTLVLKRAIAFYEKRGYHRTGKTSDFSGNTIHEFAKNLGNP